VSAADDAADTGVPGKPPAGFGEGFLSDPFYFAAVNWPRIAPPGLSFVCTLT
jgi:hypothetical protein